MVRRSSSFWPHSDDRFTEVRHALTHPTERWTLPERPDILLALDELIAWAHDTRSYDDRVHQSGWVSVIADFTAATDSIGPALAQVVQQHLHAIQGVCRGDVGGDPNLRSLLKTEAAAMRHTLGGTPALLAAWQDLLKACGRTESPIDKVARRRDTFWAIVRAADRNAKELSSSLSNVLAGRALSIEFERLQIGEMDELSSTPAELRAAAPVEVPERLRIAEAILTAVPEARAHVVWLAFRNAYLNSIGMDLPSFKFYDAQWLRGNLAPDATFHTQLPAELREHAQQDTIPDEPDVILVRVDLGVGAFSDAVRVASERLDALLAMSTIGRAEPWEPIPGFIHVFGAGFSVHGFESERRQSESRYTWQGTAAQISRRAPRVAPLIPVQDTAMRDIIDALHWWRTGLERRTAASVVLNVRVIELLAILKLIRHICKLV